MAYIALKCQPKILPMDLEAHKKGAISQSTNSRSETSAARAVAPHIPQFDSHLYQQGTPRVELSRITASICSFEIVLGDTDPRTEVDDLQSNMEIKGQYQSLEDSDDSNSNSDSEFDSKSSGMQEDKAPIIKAASSHSESQGSHDGSSMEEFHIEADFNKSEVKPCDEEYSCEHSRVLDNRAEVDAQGKPNKVGVYAVEVVYPNAQQELDQFNDDGEQVTWSDYDSDILEDFSVASYVIAANLRKDKIDSICHLPAINGWKLPSCCEPSSSTTGTRLSCGLKFGMVIDSHGKGHVSRHMRRTQSQPRKTGCRAIKGLNLTRLYLKMAISCR